MNKHSQSAPKCSPADPQREADKVEIYLGSGRDPFEEKLAELISVASWKDMLLIRKTWPDLWIKGLEKANMMEGGHWLIQAIEHIKRTTKNQEELQRLINANISTILKKEK